MRVATAVKVDADPIDSARAAGLHYVTDAAPGLTCRRTPRGLVIRDAAGRLVRDRAVVDRVRGLVLPPAWTDVWIAADPRAHLQATGRDAAGRKQYRYHPAWTAVRDATKFHRMIAFARALPSIRRHVRRDIQRPPLSREAVLATVVALLEQTHLRIGNEEYTRQNGSHGLTTLRNRHVAIRGARLRFSFKAKSGVRQDISLENARLARAVRRCQELPGQMLFQYIDDAGAVHSITSSDVNAYLRDVSGADFTAKDFRTWAGTVAAAQALAAADQTAVAAASLNKTLGQVVDQVALQLGNTRAVCRRCYIHPAVFEAYESGLTIRALPPPRHPVRGLLVTEDAVLRLLERSARKATFLAASTRAGRQASAVSRPAC